jgi:hypothetical protein
VPLPVRVTRDNLRYLLTKRDRMGHDLPDLPGAADDEVTEASADALPSAVVGKAARRAPAAAANAVRLARELSPLAQPATPPRPPDGAPGEVREDGAVGSDAGVGG